MWESSINNKTTQEIDESAQKRRDEVVANYRNTLDALEVKIKEAKNELEQLKNDQDSLHASRINEIDTRNKQLDAKKADLKAYADDLTSQSEDLADRREAFNKAVEDENSRVLANHSTLKEQQDKLDARQIALDDLEKKINEQHSANLAKQEELKSLTVEINELSTKTAAERVSFLDDLARLKADQEIHSNNVATHSTIVEDFNIERTRILSFHEALQKKERSLDDTRTSYENGIVRNQEEVKNLRDEKIRVTALSVDCDKRIKLARELEAKNAEDLKRLEALKEDIHTHIETKKES